jgi:hypothetical protein
MNRYRLVKSTVFIIIEQEIYKFSRNKEMESHDNKLPTKGNQFYKGGSPMIYDTDSKKGSQYGSVNDLIRPKRYDNYDSNYVSVNTLINHKKESETSVFPSTESKPIISQPNDPTELEADRIAEEVFGTSTIQPINRNIMHTKLITEHAGDRPGIELKIDAIKNSCGQPLPEHTKEFFKDKMGSDFGSVRIHTNQRANENAEAINARAYTVGNDIVFGKGEYQPDTREGQNLLAHELAHIRQQKSGDNLIQRKEGNKEFESAVNSSIGSFTDNASVLINVILGKGFKKNSELNIEQRDKLAKEAGNSDVSKAQASLVMAGYDLGKSGKNKNGVDGDQGPKTTLVISQFQEAAGLKVTGKLDPQTIAILDMITKAGLKKEQIETLGISSGNLGLVKVNMPLPKDKSRYHDFTPYLDASIADKFNNFVTECENEKIPLVISEGFRTKGYQKELRKKYLSGKGPFAAEPGSGPHEAGLAFDIDDKALTTEQYNKVVEIAAKYGFYRTALESKGETWHFGVWVNLEYKLAKIKQNSQDWENRFQ